MLKVHLRKVIEYAYQHGEFIEKAVSEFFGNNVIDRGMENFDAISALFSEWLIFDFEIPSGKTFVAMYSLKNPDNLSREELDELRQIIETQHFDLFEIQSLKRGEWIKTFGIFIGKEYHIHDHKGSLSFPSNGTFSGRLAKVDGIYQLIGSDPVYFPVISTPRMKKFYINTKPKNFSPKDILFFLLPKNKKNDLS
jgi:hypothetical protein